MTDTTQPASGVRTLDIYLPYRVVQQNYVEQGGVIFGWDEDALLHVEAWWLKESPPSWQADRIMREIGTYHHEG